MDVLKWREEIHKDLHEKLGSDHSAFARYCHFYDLDSLDGEVELIKLRSTQKDQSWVGFHFFNPEHEERGHALVTHGLFDHTAYMRPLIASFLRRGLSVLAVELPGHGLDFKDRLECESFDEYTAQNKKAVEWVRDQSLSLLVEVAHSTGAVGRFNQLMRAQECQHQIVFLNPLIKIQMFQLAKASHRLFPSFVSKLPRKKWGPREARDFLSFRARDPLQTWKIPRKWLSQYFDWIDLVMSCEKVDLGENVFVAQGGQDLVVNAQESKKVIASLLSNAKYSYYPKLAHQMLYGDDDELQNLLVDINRCWSGAGPGNSL